MQLRRLPTALAAILLLATVAPVAGGEATGAANGQAVPPIDDLLVDAERSGLTPTQLGAGLAAQEDVADLRGLLEEAFPDRFAGLWVDYTPFLKVTVGFVGDASTAQEAVESADPDLKGLVHFVPATRSLGEMLTALRELRGPEPFVPFDIAVNEPGNTLDIWVTSWSDLDDFLDRHDLVLPDYARVIEVAALSQPSANIYGGLRIDDSSSNDSDCTSGFGVRHRTDGREGITIAGHCPDSTMNLSGSALPHVSSFVFGSHDEQWHTAPGYTVINRIRYNESGSTRLITSRRFRSNQQIGDPMCKYGVTTGYDCGNVISRTFTPSWIANAQPTFMLAERTGVDMCSPEDSGGPVFHTNAAWGTISGYAGSGSQAGKQVVYVAIDYVESGLSVTVKTQ